MNRYLTEKARKKYWWDYPVIILSGLFAIVCIEASFQAFDVHSIGASLLAGVVTTGLAALPLIRVLIRRDRQNTAAILAKAVSNARQKCIPVDQLETLCGVKRAPQRVRKLLEKGFLQNLSFDEDHNSLNVADFEAIYKAAKAAEEAAKPRTLLADEYQERLNELERLNDQIEHRIVSRKIERIEELTAGIFGIIQEKPDRADDARRFINYYLPTTFKLLESYSLMEKQRFQGDNIRASRRQIEDVLDTLIEAIQKQQDKLFREDALDVETDISVLKTMMASDGLVGNQNTLKMQGGH